MKVLFDHHCPFMLAHGGTQIQIEQTKAALEKLGVTVEPLLAWLWIGGLVVGLGSALSFLRRRYNEEAA